MNKYDRKHLANVRQYQLQVGRIYKVAAEECAAMAAGMTAPAEGIFSLSDHPRTQRSIDTLQRQMASHLELTIVDGINAEWALSNEKNDALVTAALAESARQARYYRTNTEARDAFIARKEGGLSLSDRVWQYTEQFKSEIEMGIDCGLREGLDAAQMARQLKQYLQHPDKLFRRVRDKHGNLRLSKAAAAYHPGQGVYRSSYKNARRLAATETNIAYRTADYERWQQLDFIVGIEVHLSNNHTCLDTDGKPHPFFDICDELKGKYPKEFKFTGWHPHCRCIATTILKTESEMEADDEAILRGEQPSDPSESDNAVNDLPDNFNQWLVDNEERIVRAKSQPYFLRDNAALIKEAAQPDEFAEWWAFGAAERDALDSDWVDDVWNDEDATSRIFRFPYSSEDWDVLVEDFLRGKVPNIDEGSDDWSEDSPIEAWIIKRGKLQKVSVANLRPTQGWVDESFGYITRHYEEVKQPIPIIHIAGTDRYYVANGHHRAIQQILWGKKDINAYVVEAPDALMKKLSAGVGEQPGLAQRLEALAAKKEVKAAQRYTPATFEQLEAEFTIKTQGSAIKIFSDSNHTIHNFDLLGFKQRFGEIFGVDSSTFESEVILKKNGDWAFTMSNGEIGIRRDFKIRSNQLECHHTFFDLAESLQGQGYSKKVFRELYKEYERMGVDFLTVDANMDVGGYTWARYGFYATGEYEALGTIHGKRAIKRQAEFIIKNYYKTHDGYFPMHLLADQPWGKEMLLGRFWEGVLDLHNEEQVKIFKEYIGL